MTAKVWMTHPSLTPGHDFKADPAAVGAWMGSGWQVREDQSDPAEEVVPADPRDPVPAEPVEEFVPADPRLRDAEAEVEDEDESVGDSPEPELEIDGEPVDDESADTPVDESAPEFPALPHHPEES